MNKLFLGDSAEKLKKIEDDSVDLIVTDPPYRYGFMGKHWDQKQDFTEIWKECFRVLKPGGFAFIMNAPRSDCQLLLLTELAQVGFNIEFTPIYWTYASGFPKSANISKLIDNSVFNEWFNKKYISDIKKNKDDLSKAKTDKKLTKKIKQDFLKFKNSKKSEWTEEYGRRHLPMSEPISSNAKRFNGSFAGFQPKPAVEVVNVVMKPLSEKTYMEQALKNGKGLVWFDDCRIPYTTELEAINSNSKGYCTPSDSGIYGWNKSVKKKLVGGRANHHYSVGGEKIGGFKPDEGNVNLKGRFPANLLVSDNVLDMGKNIKSSGGKTKETYALGHNVKNSRRGGFVQKDYLSESAGGYGDSGDFSRYFSIDLWWKEHIKNLPKEVVMKLSDII